MWGHVRGGVWRRREDGCASDPLSGQSAVGEGVCWCHGNYAITLAEVWPVVFKVVSLLERAFGG